MRASFLVVLRKAVKRVPLSELEGVEKVVC
jgi:hypothetical protein